MSTFTLSKNRQVSIFACIACYTMSKHSDKQSLRHLHINMNRPDKDGHAGQGQTLDKTCSCL